MNFRSVLTSAISSIDSLPLVLDKSSCPGGLQLKTRSNLDSVVVGRRISKFVLLAIALSAPHSYAHAQVFTSQDEESRPTIAPMLQDVTPSVVNISISGRASLPSNSLLDDPIFRRFFDLPDVGPTIPRQAAGSGVIVDSHNGYILTNHHVIAGADEIIVATQDHRRFDSILVGSDEGTDIALLQIDADALEEIDFGDSDEIRVGDFVAAIGNPFGLGQTVTVGIISALGRSGLNVEEYENFIQTDASINVGNSGGALVDFNGELIGINTAIISPGGGSVGIGFAIPVNMARAIMNQLIEYGVVRRGKLGVYIQDITPDLAAALELDASEGIIITQIEHGSAADRAGLLPGDIITSVDGNTITRAGQLRNLIGLMRVGDQLNITYIRNGKRKEAIAQISNIDEEVLGTENDVPQLAGTEFQDMPSNHPLYDETRGVIVADVRSGSSAARLGLQQGDVLVSVNRDRVMSVKEFSNAITSARKPTALGVIRGGGRFFLVIN